MTAAEAAAHLAVCRAIVAATDASILTTSPVVARLLAVAEHYAAECARLEHNATCLGRTIDELRDLFDGSVPDVEPAPQRDPKLLPFRKARA